MRVGGGWGGGGGEWRGLCRTRLTSPECAEYRISGSKISIIHVQMRTASTGGVLSMTAGGVRPRPHGIRSVGRAPWTGGRGRVINSYPFDMPATIDALRTIADIIFIDIFIFFTQM